MTSMPDSSEREIDLPDHSSAFSSAVADLIKQDAEAATRTRARLIYTLIVIAVTAVLGGLRVFGLLA